MNFLETFSGINNFRHPVQIDTLWDRIDRVSPSLTREIVLIFECNALVSLVNTALMNGLYAFGPNWDVPFEISTRLRSLETSILALASSVYNFVLASAFTLVAACTLGKVKSLNFYLWKHWKFTGVSFASFIIAIGGVFCTRLGVVGTLILAGVIALKIFKNLNREGVAVIAQEAQTIADGVSRIINLFGVEINAEELTDQIRNIHSTSDLSDIIFRNIGQRVMQSFAESFISESINNGRLQDLVTGFINPFLNQSGE